MFVSVVYLLLVLIQVTCAVPLTDPGIISPADGDVIVAGSAFPFEYNTRADYDVTSYNYTAWLFTTRPESLNPSDLFATGYFFGRYSQPNYPGNPYPKNQPPSQLIMPDFSQSLGGFGIGSPNTTMECSLVVLEEYGTDIVSVLILRLDYQVDAAVQGYRWFENQLGRNKDHLQKRNLIFERSLTFGTATNDHWDRTRFMDNLLT
ncbi:hypothetical protein C0993_006498 [Termitomyces sp. T159_Od127]|nr:hypothetical protein C0993_006498 [Termitomyces sp. T159_Od127]